MFLPTISTSFISQTVADGAELLETIADYGVHRIELDCRVTRTQYQQIKAGLNQAHMQVGSLHNYCPFPALKPKQPPGGDYFMLASLDKSERDLAVAWTAKTIEHADDLEAGFVVLHCGAVEMDSIHQRIYSQYNSSPENPETWQEMVSLELDRRRHHNPPHLDAIRFSLERLLNIAMKYQVTLGLETRAHYFEIPDKDELGLLFTEFEGAPIGYWHDTGHAHLQEQLGVVSQKELLAAHAGNLVGIHLHDAIGLRDHLAPGNGEIDFDILKPYLKTGPSVVIELAPGTAEEDVRLAVSFVQELLNADE